LYRPSISNLGIYSRKTKANNIKGLHVGGKKEHDKALE